MPESTPPAGAVDAVSVSVAAVDAGRDAAAMRLAIEASQAALDRGDMPFGATLVSGAGERLLVAGNDQNTRRDVTGHAEMVLVREASRQHGAAALIGSTVYASGEPCAMCAGAMFWAGVSRVVYAASQADIRRELGGSVLPIGSREVYSGAHPPVRVDGPVLGEEAIAVLREAARRAG